MKRTMSRLLRLHAENAEIRESDAAYIGKHEPIAQIINSIAEIFDECMRKLGITAEMSAEIVPEHAENCAENSSAHSAHVGNSSSENYARPYLRKVGDATCRLNRNLLRKNVYIGELYA